MARRIIKHGQGLRRYRLVLHDFSTIHSEVIQKRERAFQKTMDVLFGYNWRQNVVAKLGN